MNDDIRQSVYDLLDQFPAAKLDAMKQLFWSELNYNRANEPLSTRTWPDSAREAVAETPTLFATAGDSDGFHIIYNRLPTDRLLLGPQRPVISHLVQQHPYSLFVFSNKPQTDWHFVNVRYEKTPTPSPSPATGEGRKTSPPSGGNEGGQPTRRVFRRITVGPRERLRTATERISMIDIATLSPDLFGLSPLAIQQRHDDAFDVEKVTKDFFRTYHAIFSLAEEKISGLAGDDKRRLFTQRLFNRLLFIIFLERKGWLKFNGDRDYLQALWSAHRREVKQGETSASFYANRLQVLFFSGLNNPTDLDLSQGVAPLIGQVPYLNGGLFEPDKLDTDPAIDVPDSVLAPAVDELLYRYNYTVTESTPLDIEVAVDPEMLGKIFEELVTGRHESGSYYTPKPIVAFMGQEALKGYLATACPAESEEALAAFVQQRDATGLRNPERVLAALKTVKICDPACGSGAYLLGMLHELLELRAALFAARRLDDQTIYQRKLEIIQNNLYGVDIDPFAVNIARLRLWLSLIVDFEGAKPLPLPNLDFKIEVGDSLASPDPSGGLDGGFYRYQIEQFFQLKGQYLQAHGKAKELLRDEIESLRSEIKKWAHGAETVSGFDWAVEFAEVFAETPPQATLTGAMAGLVNAAPGQLQMTEAPTPGGFDIVLANPPYVRQELIKELKPMLKKGYPEVYRGTADLYVFFYARALQLLKPGGMLAFISSNKWLRAKYGEKLRAHFAANANVHNIIDFGELPVFETAATFPMIFLAEAGNKQSSFSFTQVQTLKNPYPDVRIIVEKSGQYLPISAINKDVWYLSDAQNIRLLTKLESKHQTLGSVTKGKIFRGVVTGLNNAFYIDAKKRNQLIEKDPRNEEIIKPLLVGDNVRRWRCEQRQYFIVTYIGVDIDNYPTIFEHLSQRKSRLQKRWDKGNYWWELRSCSYYDEFEKPKIVYPDIGKEARFAFDNKGNYLDATATCIASQDKFLLGLLNSSVVWHYFSQKCAVLGDASKGGRIRLKTFYVEQLPVPDATPAQRAAIEALVQNCLDARGQGPQVAQWEAEINQIVYQLYGLTRAEIRLVEEAVDPTP